MSKRNVKIILLAAAAGFILAQVPQCSANQQGMIADPNVPSKPNLEMAYDNMVQKFTPKVEDYFPGEKSTNEMIYSSQNCKNNEALMDFARQLDIQAREYVAQYQLKRAQDGLKKLFKLIFSFHDNSEPLKGIYFHDLNFDQQNEIILIKRDIHCMYSNGYPLEAIGGKMLVKAVRRIGINWAHIEE